MSSLYAGELADAVAGPAREDFLHAMSRASAFVAVVAALGAWIAWRYLPARGEARQPAKDLNTSVIA
jgi:hypothetical protein